MAGYALLVKKERSHEDKVYAGAWAQISVDNQKHDYIVTGALDKLVKVWQFENHQLDLLHTLEGHRLGVMSVTVSRDGHTIASISLDDTLIIWELLSGNKVHVVEYIGSAFWTSAFSPQGDFLAATGYSGQIVIRHMGKNEEVQAIDIRTNVDGKFIISLDWSSDGKMLAMGAVDGVLRIYDMSKNGLLMHTIQSHKDAIRKVAFSPNSKFLASASADGMVKIYKCKTAQLAGTIQHKSWAMGVCFSKDGTQIATSDGIGSVRIVRAQLARNHGDSEDEASGHETTSNPTGKVRTVDASTSTAPVGVGPLELEVLYIFKEHVMTALSVHFSPDQTMVMSVSKDRSINIYSIPPLPKLKQ